MVIIIIYFTANTKQTRSRDSAYASPTLNSAKKNRAINRLKSVKPIEPNAKFKDFLKSSDVKLPKRLFDLIDMQLKAYKKTAKNPWYSDEFKQFALTLYFMGPKAYRFLAKTMKLPSIKTLKRITQNWPNHPGLSEVLFEAVKFSTSGYFEIDKNCTLAIDEMSLKSNLCYNIYKDKIIGYDSVRYSLLM